MKLTMRWSLVAVAGLVTAGCGTPDAAVVDSGPNFGTTIVMDGDVAASASDLNLTSVSIVATEPVNVTSFVLTEGNP